MTINWPLYLKETEGFELYQANHSYCFYREESPGVFYIRDVFTDPDFRDRKDVLKSLSDFQYFMVTEKKAHRLIGTVTLKTLYTERSIRLMLSLGFTVDGMNGIGQLVFVKEIG